jgi:hypothetical protein
MNLTERSSSNGTISSTRVFGVFPSGVTPVAQHCENETNEERKKKRERGGTAPAQRPPQPEASSCQTESCTSPPW